MSYENHWPGTLIGLPTGTFAGRGYGIFVGSYYYGQGNNKFDTIQLIFLPGGSIVRAILGSIMGYTYAYQFNP